ncbi:MAG: fused MFS/spermidine synthase [Planctomycetes bacterium]|nr:fused MFS/spermidine synthase [Planctomycetota bacterium]
MQSLSPSQSPAAAQRFLPLLTLLFMGSGCSALIYEVVWLQSLQLVIGSSAVSLGVLLGTFMGGMCLGSLLLPRVVSVRRHPLRVYALIELGIGIAGLALLLGMPYVDQLYAAHVRPGLASILLRGAVCAICLLPPTLLMGATLPAIARWVEATPQGVSWLGFFYGSNIAGAVFGCLLAGFYLLRVHDGAIATYVAAALNFTVAVTALLLADQAAHQPTRRVGWAHQPDQGTQEKWWAQPTLRDSQTPGTWIVYVVIALSGLTALGAEVVWTRNLSLLLGGTVYTFSIILAVFLVGLGIGSSIGSVISRHSLRPRLALGICQLLLMGAIAWAAYALADSLPYWPIDPSLSRNPWIGFQLDLMRCVWAVLPGAILWGASFPLALASAVSPGREPGRIVGGVYAANTVGAIVGSLAFSMILIPWLGTRGSQRVMIGAAAVSVLLLFVATIWAQAGERICAEEQSGTYEGREVRRKLLPSYLLTFFASFGVAVLAVPLVWSVPTIPAGLIAYGRYLPSRTQVAEAIYTGEGMNSTVAVTLLDGEILSFHVCGKVEASTEPADMRLQRMLGHLSALLHPQPRSILVVGCGAGVTAGTFVLYPEVERIILCEIEPLIPRIAAGFFGKENYQVLHDPRVEVVYDDARHYLLTTREKFDVITSDPIHPWVRGSAALYTREYFELCQRHLNPGGVVTQWVPLYESSPAVVKSEMATFFGAFPDGTIWSNDINGEGYDVVLLGHAEPVRIDVDALTQRLERRDHLAVVQSLAEVKFASALELLSTYAGQAADLQDWLRTAEINTDRNLRLQYLAGLGLNAYEGTPIYKEILSYRTFPENLFLGSSEPKLQLRAKLGRPPGAP